MWTVIVGAAVLSAIPIVVGALEAPPDSPLRYRLFGTLGVHIGVLLVPAVFLVFSIPGRIRLTRARAETPGALYIVHSDLAEGGYEAIQVLGATPFRNYAVVNQTLCFAPEGLTVYRGLGRRVFFLPVESIATVRLVRVLPSPVASEVCGDLGRGQKRPQHSNTRMNGPERALRYPRRR
ncbi:hypothetical protein GCM10010471_19230 [Leucobacter komagatae]